MSRLRFKVLVVFRTTGLDPETLERHRPGDLTRQGEGREATTGDRHHHGVEPVGRAVDDLSPLVFGDDL